MIAKKQTNLINNIDHNENLTGQQKCLEFTVISDPHLVSPDSRNDIRLAEDSVAIFRETIKKIQLTNPDFIIITGDVMEAKEYGFPNLGLAFDEISKISIPWFIIMGNHDSRYRSTKDNYQKIDFVKKFESHGPIGNVASWKKDIENKRITLIGLDTSQEGTSEGFIDTQQLDWLQNQLNSISLNRFVFIFMHHPPIIFDKIVKDNKDLKMYCLNNHIQLQGLLKKYKVIKAVIFGHSHVRRYRFKDGIHYIGVPSINTWPNMFTEFSINNKSIVYKHVPISNRSIIKEAKSKLFNNNPVGLNIFNGNKDELKAYYSRGKNQRILEL